MKEKVNCLKCKHYYNTWDPKFPRGCRIFHFKGKNFPSVSVKEETKEECQGFSPNGKAVKEAISKKLDLNNDDLW